MFQSGQLSRGAVCEFAEVDIYDFLAACKRHRINVMDTTADAIENDALRFQQRHFV